MHAEKSVRSRGEEECRGRRRGPRVVIFDAPDNVRVAVVDLPEDAAVGDRICHDGRDWCITDSRTGTRVLIAEPEAN
ncbi:MAG: hypothetical protein V2I67_02765 [Thermoanaerobaculales bacterium]|jgi:hypothetical protein|nr:hypothetical protein [Thermoanaerobaculales bacterium]